MQKLILTDVDDTVLRYADHFQAWAEKKGYEFMHPLRGAYSIEETLGVTTEAAIDLMHQCTAEGWLDEQPPEDCALEVLPALHKAGYSFVAITACGIDLAFQKARKKRLEEVFGFRWQAVHLVGLRASKKPLLNAYDPAIWVEDNLGHAVDGALIGHETFLLTRPYNETTECSSYNRVSSWHDIAARIL